MSKAEPIWVRLLAALLDWWSGRQRQLGREEYHAEAQATHDERVAMAEAARRDADAAVDPDRMRDPFDRDHH